MPAGTRPVVEVGLNAGQKLRPAVSRLPQGDLSVRAVNLDAESAALGERIEEAALYLEHLFRDEDGHAVSFGWFFLGGWEAGRRTLLVDLTVKSRLRQAQTKVAALLS